MVDQYDSLQIWDEMHRTTLLTIPLRVITCKGTLNIAKVQYKLCFAFCPNLPWYGSQKYGMECGRKF